MNIERQVTHRCCPSCGFLITQEQVELLRFAVDCSNCQEHTINDFQPVKLPEPTLKMLELMESHRQRVVKSLAVPVEELMSKVVLKGRKHGRSKRINTGAIGHLMSNGIKPLPSSKIQETNYRQFEKRDKRKNFRR